jgi:hypothetical protein
MEALNSAAEKYSKGEHMKSNIKTAIATTFLAGAILLSMGSNASALAPKSCSNATLRGDYAATLTGTVNNLPFAALNLVNGDGNGNITGEGTIVYNGSVIPSSFTATYSINADCSGSFSSSSGTTENIVISRDGSEVQIIVTGLALGPATVTGLAKSLGSAKAMTQ